MMNSIDDTAEMTIDFSTTATQPPSVDPAVLRRALTYGQKARFLFPSQHFCDVESNLRAGWEKKGEVTEWDWVRAAVRAGFDQDMSSED